MTAAVRLDGTGASVERAADDLAGALADAVADLEARQAREAEELAAELERDGHSDRAASSLATRLAERHRRQHRAARREALAEGIVALETVYLDALAGSDAPGAQPRPSAACDSTAGPARGRSTHAAPHARRSSATRTRRSSSNACSCTCPVRPHHTRGSRPSAR